MSDGPYFALLIHMLYPSLVCVCVHETRTYGLTAMRRNLPSVTEALFQEVVSCPENAVVTAAVETIRVLAAHLSNPRGITSDEDASAAEADWEAFVKSFVYKSVGEVKASPNSLMGR